MSIIVVPAPLQGRLRPLTFCCGVVEVGYMYEVGNDNEIPESYINIEKVPYQGTGIMIVNYIESSSCRKAKAIMDTNHKLLFQADNRRNTSISAGQGGLTGITTCVYLHKDAPDSDILTDIYKRKEMV